MTPSSIISPARVAQGMWWDRAWQLTSGCSPVSPGCLHCWSARAAHMRQSNPSPKVAARNAGVTVRPQTGARYEEPIFNGTVRCNEDRLELPIRRRVPTVWSVWDDLFHEKVPFDFIDRAFAVMALCPLHVFVVCTKRPERMREYLSETQPGDMAEHIAWIAKPMKGDRRNLRAHQNPDLTFGESFLWPLPNLILMTTAEDQKRADERLPHLLACPAACRAVAIEPALGAVDIEDYLGRFERFHCNACGHDFDWRAMQTMSVCLWICPKCAGTEPLVDTGKPPIIHGTQPAISWVIIGQDTGPRARKAEKGWFLDVRDQCAAAGVPLFVKASPHGNGLIDEVEYRDFPNLETGA